MEEKKELCWSRSEQRGNMEPRAQNGLFPLHLRLWHFKCSWSLFQKISIKGLSILDTPKHFIITEVPTRVSPPLEVHFSSLQCVCVKLCCHQCHRVKWCLKGQVSDSQQWLQIEMQCWHIHNTGSENGWVWIGTTFFKSNGRWGQCWKLCCYEKFEWISWCTSWFYMSIGWSYMPI